MIALTRRYRFSASHRLHAEEMSAEQNRELYGKCNNPYGHGHNYVLEVTVRGRIDPVSGLVADVNALDRLVREQVLEPFEHKNLNTDVPEFQTIVPTSENVALAIKHRLCTHWARGFAGASRPNLERVRILETRNNIIEVSNERR